ncbi:unnamed protein product [Caenorhabditis nigoni]
MPVNLLKLPFLVSGFVVTELDYQELFLLSKCSHRTYCLVEKARITVPKINFQFEKCDGYDTILVKAGTDKGRFYITSVKHVSELDLEGVANVNPGLESTIETWYEEEQSRYRNVTRFRHRIKRTSEPMAVQKSVQDHINSIFHYTGPYKLLLSMECEGPLPNIKNVKYLTIMDDAVDTQILTNVLEKYPDIRTLAVFSDIIGDIPNDSPLFQVQSLSVKPRCGPDFFHNFVGRNLWLICVTFTEQDIIQFLHKWIANEAYHNLETAIIRAEPTFRINENLILESIEFEEYDSEEPEKRPKSYVVDDAPSPKPRHPDLGHPDPGHPNPDHPDPGNPNPGHPDPGHPDPGCPDLGHPDPGHPDPGHLDPNYPDPGHPDPGHPDPGYPDLGHPDPGHPDPGPPDPGHPEPRHPDPGHPNPDHPDPGHPNPGYPDLCHPDPGHPNPGHPDPGHPDPGYPDPGHPDPGHPDPGHADPGHPDPGPTQDLEPRTQIPETRAQDSRITCSGAQRR